MKRSSLVKLALIPAVVTVFPAELFGLDASYLLRLPILGPNGFPYWEPLLFSVVFFGVLSARPYPHRVVYMCGVISVSTAVIYTLFRASGPANQIFGLFLQFSSVAAMSLSANAPQSVRSSLGLERPLVLGGVFVLVSSCVLMLSATGIAGWWEEAVVKLDRFGGLDERIRWATVRLQDRMLMTFLISYCTVLSFQKRRVIFLLVPVLFGIAQIVQSSRGGVLLVVAATIVGVQFGANGGGAAGPKSGSRILRTLAVIVPVALMASAALFLSERAKILLSTSVELTDEGGIRNRMYAAALTLVDDRFGFGAGYIDLFSTPEWAPFLMPNMLLPLHNMFMQAVLYEGVFGLLLWVIPTLIAARAALHLLLKTHQVEEQLRPLISGLVATVPAHLYMMTLQTLDRVSLVSTWIVLGSIVSMQRHISRTVP